jgi:hypothetical protein
MSASIDLQGMRFGRLTVLGLHPERANRGGSRWHGICDCGTARVVVSDSLRSGHATSCGCVQRETMRNGRRDVNGYVNRGHRHDHDQLHRGDRPDDRSGHLDLGRDRPRRCFRFWKRWRAETRRRDIDQGRRPDRGSP